MTAASLRAQRRGITLQVTLLGAALLCLAMCLIACGGSASIAAGSTSAFVRSVNQICAAYYERAFAMPPPVGLGQEFALLEKRQSLLEQELSGLRAVSPPQTSRAAYTAYLAEMAAHEHLLGSRTAALLADVKAAYTSKAFLAPGSPTRSARLQPETNAARSLTPTKTSDVHALERETRSSEQRSIARLNASA